MSRSFQIARYGYGGTAFGGVDVFPGGPQFQSSDGYNIFFDTGKSAWAEGARAYGINYVGPSQAIVRAADQTWRKLAASSDLSDASFKDQMTSRMTGAIAAIDQLASAKDFFGHYTPQVTQQLVDRLNELKNLVKQVGAYQPAPPAPVSSGSSMTAGGVGSGSSNSDDGGFPWLYVGLGGAVLLVGTYFVFRRSSSVAGYRRRRRR